MPILAIANRKGGTGKTTLAVNLAAEFAARNRRVLLVDLDTQGHCAVGLGVRVSAAEPTVHRLFLDPQAALAPAILPTGIKGLWLAPADPRLEHSRCDPDPSRLKTALA
ncbi:MAG: AAA family ATPase, partial [Rhodocyclaceae bacterium]|nr:AAA family ATPase [Rhodocyclaceae bacterium]